MNKGAVVVLSTTDNIETARLIAESLVFERLAACVQIGSPIKSTYVWEGSVRVETEYPISIKSVAEHLPELRERFAQMHSYECPQWIVLEAQASEEYLKWLRSSCNSD